MRPSAFVYKFSTFAVFSLTSPPTPFFVELSDFLLSLLPPPITTCHFSSSHCPLRKVTEHGTINLISTQQQKRNKAPAAHLLPVIYNCFVF